MQQYKLTLSYNGTDFCGWQQQPSGNGVLDLLLKTFQKLFATSCTILGASRTDAGVHALGQVALLKTPLLLDPVALKLSWNSALPSSILIRSIELVCDTFHPWYNGLYKEYYYHVCTKRPLPFIAPFVWQYKYPLDMRKLQNCLNLFAGTHDFRAFIAAGDARETVRTIEYLRVVYLRRFGVYQIRVRGKSFARHLIRRIVGACVSVAARPSADVSQLQQLIDSQDPNHAWVKAPASGLLLRKIAYKSE